MANPISPFTGSLSVNLTGQVPYSDVVRGLKTTFSPGINLSLPFQNATVSLPNEKAVQYLVLEDTVAGGANTTIDLTGTFTNAAGTASASFTSSILAMILYLPATTDPKGVSLGLSAQASSVTIGDAASNAWSSLLGATSTITLKPGQFICFGDLSGVNPLAIGSSNKNLYIVNNDGSNAANLLRYMVGN